MKYFFKFYKQNFLSPTNFNSDSFLKLLFRYLTYKTKQKKFFAYDESERG